MSLATKKTIWSTTIVLFIVVISAITFISAQSKGALELSDAWIPLAPAKAKILEAYLTIRNPTSRPIEISKVSSPDFASAMIHETLAIDGVPRTQAQEKLLLSAGETVVLQRHGLHVKLMYKKRAFKEGDKVILRFITNVGTVSIPAIVKIAPVSK